MLSINKATMLSFAFSYLIPPSLRDLILSTIEFERTDFSIMSVGVLTQQDVGKALRDITKESEAYFTRYDDFSRLLTQLAHEGLEKTNIALSDEVSPEHKRLAEQMLHDIECLLTSLQNKSNAIHPVKVSLDNVSQRIGVFLNESQRKKVLSHGSFFLNETLASPKVSSIRLDEKGDPDDNTDRHPFDI